MKETIRYLAICALAILCTIWIINGKHQISVLY
jgi:hypothetical protein